MATYTIQEESLVAIADAIRAKKGTSAFFSPEQMAVEIEGIAGAADMPDAEGVAFGTAVGEVDGAEPGMTSHGSFTKASSTDNRQVGYEFTVNENLAFAGFRVMVATIANFNAFLWDTESGEILLKQVIIPTKTGEWETHLSNSVNLIAGKTYAISCIQSVKFYYASSSGFAFHSKITKKNYLQSYDLDDVENPPYPNQINNSWVFSVDFLIKEIITGSEVTEYKIQKSTLMSLAAAVNTCTGNTGKLTPEGMINVLNATVSG